MFRLEKNPNPIQIYDGSNVFELMDLVGEDAKLIILMVGVPGIGKTTTIEKMKDQLDKHFGHKLFICDLDDRQSKFWTIPSFFRYILPASLYQSLAGKRIVDPEGSDKAMQSTWIHFCDLLSQGSVALPDAGPNFWMRFQMVTTAKLRAYTRNEVYQELGLEMPTERYHVHLVLVKGKKFSWLQAWNRNLKRERIVHPKPFFNAVRGVKNGFRSMLPYCDSWGIVEID